MPDYPLQEIDGIRYPKRRPLLVLLVVVALTGMVLWLIMRQPSEPRPKRERKAPAAVVESTSPAVAPAGRAASPPVVAAPPSPAIAALLQQARQAESQAPQRPEALAEARRLYLEALKGPLDAANRTDVETRLGRVNVELAFSPLPLPGLKTEYVVRSGDSISRIANRLKTTTALIQRGNGVTNPNRIRAGDRFLILTGQWSLHARKGAYDLEVRLNDTFFKRYQVGMGAFGKTPVGTFVVSDRIAEPVWWPSDGKEIPFGHPDNILGTRWLAIKATGDTPDVKGYGIHGTWNNDSIGKAESAGCIRMRNTDVEELFDLIPLGTPVTIRD